MCIIMSMFMCMSNTNFIFLDNLTMYTAFGIIMLRLVVANIIFHYVQKYTF